eukprot:gene56089-4130_t
MQGQLEEQKKELKRALEEVKRATVAQLDEQKEELKRELEEVKRAAVTEKVERDDGSTKAQALG